MDSLTVAYITSRKDSKIHWFFDSLSRQLRDDEIQNAIVVDHHIEHPIRYTRSQVNLEVTYTSPKPNVWNGKYRLTKQDWWSAASMRNTALCLCDTTHIAYVDDLSVLMPGWLEAVREAVAGNYIGCGAYKKVNKLKVENGVPASYEEFPDGLDHRLSRVTGDLSPCDPGWLFGCSCVFPVEDLLECGGWPEYVDGMGAEDYTLGIALRNNGKHLKYDRRMLTLESWEDHFKETPMKKTDKGISPNDKSHAALNIAKQTKFFDNYYEGGISALRDYVLKGNPFPVVSIPQHDWYDGQPVSEM